MGRHLVVHAGGRLAAEAPLRLTPREAAAPLCVGCRYARPESSFLARLLGIESDRAWRLARCVHPSARRGEMAHEHLVHGRELPPGHHHLCSSERGDEHEGHCGLGGRFREPR